MKDLLKQLAGINDTARSRTAEELARELHELSSAFATHAKLPSLCGATQPITECDPKLRGTGVTILMLGGLASTAIEAQVVRWREELGVPLDWHFVGGRAVVKCHHDDVVKVRRHLREFEVSAVEL